MIRTPKRGASKGYKFRPVRRIVAPAMIPHIVTEEGLPKNQRVLVFLPHTDDGRYIAGSLAYMNMPNLEKSRKPRNKMKIVVVSRGYHDRPEGMPKEARAEERWNEGVVWANILGFKERQMINFRADKTYDARSRVKSDDQRRMDQLIRAEKPTMVFIPTIHDTAQHINFNTRRMVMGAVNKWLAEEAKAGRAHRSPFVAEYPTNNMPLLPPADKNFQMMFSDKGRTLSEVKHMANKAHRESGFSDIVPRMVEAVEAVQGADELEQIRRAGRKYSRHLSGVEVNPDKSRGEHLHVTRLRIAKRGARPLIVEERVKFPLSPELKKRWGY